ncbi:MAG: T9SS type A sorting domain-containing protein [Chitinophagales bacterium]
MKNQFYILLILFFAFRIQSAEASHIIGGELSYTCLGNNNYKIEVKVYRDCYNVEILFDDPTNVFIFNSSGDLVNTLHIAFPGSDTIPVASNCGIPVPFVCVEEAVFIDSVNLPPSPGGYTMVYQRCCLTYIVNNIVNPYNTGLSIFATIPDASVASCNSSPVFISYPPTVFCTGVPINFDHSAIDPDGDSLVYELCTGIAGADIFNPYPNPPLPPPYPEMIYDAGYSGYYPMNTDPVLAIDPVTGEITGTPTAVGIYMVSICVKEYRNGNLLSVHRRMINLHTEAYYLSAESLMLTESLNIFPNPGSDIMKIELSGNTSINHEWRIYNSQGVLVNASLIANNADAIELNVEGYAEGVYRFQWIHHDKVLTKSFIVSR